MSSTVLFGTGIGSAYYMLLSSLAARRRGGDATVVAEVVRHVVRADLWFTTPTIVLQPLSGAALVHLAAMPWSSTWLAASVVLYAIAVAAWLPVVWLQLRMRDLAREAAAARQPLPERYWRHLRLWVALGVVAFVALMAVFYLMVLKPA